MMPLLFMFAILFQGLDPKDHVAHDLESAKMPLPVYLCPKVQKPIPLTGKLDDPQWAKAPVVTLVRSESGEPGRFRTEARLLYSDSLLYVGFHCEDDHAWGTRTARDSDIYSEECVEVFLDPAGIAYQYYEINVSPKNVVYDACILNPRTPEKPEAPLIVLSQYDVKGLVTAAYVEGVADPPGGARFWNVEYAIPFGQLVGAPHVPPQKGDEWRANLYRIDWPEGGIQEHYAWNPTGNARFHLPWKFGILRFE